MSTKPLTTTMAAGLDLAIEHGGKLERVHHSYWTYPACQMRRRTAARPSADWYVGHTTVNALLIEAA